MTLTADVHCLAQLRAGLRQRMLQVGEGGGEALHSLLSCPPLSYFVAGKPSKYSPLPRLTVSPCLPAPARAVAPV